MPRTLRVPEELDGASLEAYVVEELGAVHATEPIVRFDLDGRKFTVQADTDAIVLRLLADPGMPCGGGAPIALLGSPGESIGYDPAVVQCVRLLLLSRCDECGNDYPVNGLVERVRCTRCGEVERVPAGYWRTYVLEHVQAAREPRKASAANVLGGRHGAATVQCWGIPPLCRKCMTLIDWNLLVQAWSKVQQGPASICCNACGEPHVARLPPAWAVETFPGLVFAFGETALGVSSEPPRPVVFSCPSCGASLKIDGEKRIVRCAYCDSDVYLPDELWLHLNPSAKRGRWWMLFRP